MTVIDPPLAKSLSDMLRPHLPDAVEEIEREVRVHVHEGGPPVDADYRRAVRQVIDETVAHFVDSLGRPATDSTRLTELYSQLGAEAACRGYSLDRLQTALRLSGQVACRRFIKDAYRFSWPKETLSSLTDGLFGLLAQAADAGAQGYARQQGELATDRERRRRRLRNLLVRELPPDPGMIHEQARAADWRVPGTVAAVALVSAAHPPSRILPPDVLADWDASYLIVPDPDSAGREWLPTLLVPLGAAAIGPTVPAERTAVSLRWARRTVALMERGVLPSDRPQRAADHTALLAAAMVEDLIDTTSAVFLAPILALPPRRRVPLLTTLLTYLQCGDNAVITSARLQVHEQTVRYRLRRIAELTGSRVYDPADRLDLMITLTWLLHTDGITAAPGAAPGNPAVTPARSAPS
ncbi:helix-turn-helix domain-containing protein [Streptomyces sp. GESEQ-4]|uniref:helix-turn-helix domain-containing protein n=1 Tax=Streptomyces sp. GESEQ-4 TaxID=2812655 RepID=UPI001B321527|nr:helix-turn-helix domain-containing protein [Streptomyces sp. GESEQ-4]